MVGSGSNGGEISGTKPHNYCLNNPVAYIDEAGNTPKLYVETTGFGHAFVTTGPEK